MNLKIYPLLNVEAGGWGGGHKDSLTNQTNKISNDEDL